MRQTLYEKIFDRHVVREVTPGQYQLTADVHLLNEVSSPQAFEALRERGLHVRHPERTFGSSDHSISTSGNPKDFVDPMAAAQVEAMGHGAEVFRQEALYQVLVDVTWADTLVAQPIAEVEPGGSVATTALSSIAAAREVIGVEADDRPEDVGWIFGPKLKAEGAWPVGRHLGCDRGVER